MSCVIPNANIKRFGRAFSALGKLGDAVYIDINRECFLLHTVNASRSAYGSFKFYPGFFSTYTVSDETSNCKVAIKSCFMVFKSLAIIEKNTDQCCLEMSSETNSLCIKLICKHSIQKVYTLPFIESETLKTSFQIDSNTNILRAQSKLLFDSVQNFQSSVEEVTLKVTQEKVYLKNYTEDEKDPSKVVHTEVAYEIEEFDHHEFDNDSDITFCLKEFKAILNYLDGLNLPLTILFGEAGRPIVFTVEKISDFEVTFTLATLADMPPEATPSSKGTSKKAVPSRTDTQDTAKTCTTLRSESACQSGTNILVDLTEDDDVIPSTPPKKRFRDQFLGLNVGSQFTSMLVQPDPVLVKCSDDEDEDGD